MEGEMGDLWNHIVNMDGHLPSTCSADLLAYLWLQCKQVQALLSTNFCWSTPPQRNPKAGGPQLEWGGLSVSWLTAATTPPACTPQTCRTHSHKHTYIHCSLLSSKVQEFTVGCQEFGNKNWPGCQYFLPEFLNLSKVGIKNLSA